MTRGKKGKQITDYQLRKEYNGLKNFDPYWKLTYKEYKEART